MFLLCYLMSLCCNVCSPLYANCTLYSVSMCTHYLHTTGVRVYLCGELYSLRVP